MTTHAAIGTHPRGRVGGTAVGRSASGRRRSLVVLGMAATAVASLLVARSGHDHARQHAVASAAVLDRAADARAEAEDGEARARGERRVALAAAADAADARRAQRERLLGLGLTEDSVDAFVDRVEANTELVEWRRDGVTEEITLQAAQIPQMDQCLVAARHAVNIAFGTVRDPAADVPTPTQVCLALMAPP